MKGKGSQADMIFEMTNFIKTIATVFHDSDIQLLTPSHQVVT